MSHRDYVVKLISSNEFKKIVEIGIWKGELSRKIMSECKFEELVLIDPLTEDVNNFNLSENERFPPKIMKVGTYRCGRDEHQNEFDQWYSSLKDQVDKDSRVKLIRKKSEEVFDKFNDGHFDLVFIDAIHLYENVLIDIENWIKKVKIGGIISGDDYSESTFPGVIEAVNDSFAGLNITTCSKTGVWHHKVTDMSYEKVLFNVLQARNKK